MPSEPTLRLVPEEGWEPAGPDAYLPPEPHRMTDRGNAGLLAELHARDLRWCGSMPGTGWMVWDRNRWVPDETRHVHRLAAQLGDVWRQRAPELLSPLTPAERKAMTDEEADAYDLKAQEVQKLHDAMHKWAHRCEGAGTIRAAMDLLGAREEVVVRKDRWDADPWLFNTPDYTYDCQAGERYEPRRTDHITRCASVGADPEMGCPEWLRFLDRVMGGDSELVAFLQRAVGYSLTGNTGEQCLFIAYGRGANGKSTFMDMVQYLMGDYARTTPVTTFIDRQKGAIPNDLAALAGARLVVCNETPEGGGLDEALVKVATGGDVISARFLNREFFDFKPAFKLWMLTNHKPMIKGTDEGIWRRLRLVPFTVTIPKEERDPDLPAKLKREACGIMQWALDGLREWRRIGLAPPAAVLSATESYREEMDILADFLREKCQIGENLEAKNGALYAAYQAWAKEQGLLVRSHKWLTRALQDRGFRQEDGRANGRLWRGLTYISEPPVPSRAPPKEELLW